MWEEGKKICLFFFDKIPTYFYSGTTKPKCFLLGTRVPISQAQKDRPHGASGPSVFHLLHPVAHL
jgi:hypothetical protein